MCIANSWKKRLAVERDNKFSFINRVTHFLSKKRKPKHQRSDNVKH